MGATTFRRTITVEEGEDLETVYERLHRQDERQHGADGYSGTLSQKPNVTRVSIPKGVDHEDVLDLWYLGKEVSSITGATPDIETRHGEFKIDSHRQPEEKVERLESLVEEHPRLAKRVLTEPKFQDKWCQTAPAIEIGPGKFLVFAWVAR